MPNTVLNEKIRDFEVAVVELGPFHWELYVWYHAKGWANTKWPPLFSNIEPKGQTLEAKNQKLNLLTFIYDRSETSTVE